MSQITFQVVDTSCESAPAPLVVPQVSLQAVSSTQIATVLGYPEWPGFASSPPKKYHNLSWAGTSEHQLWFIGSITPAYQYVLIDYYGLVQFVALDGGYGYNGIVLGAQGLGPAGIENHWLLNGIWVGPDAGHVDAPVGPAGAYQNIGNAPYFLIPPNGLPQTVNVTGPFTQPAVPIPDAQIGGARYDYSGSDVIDTNGNVTATHTKNYSAQCDGSRGVYANIQGNAPNGTSITYNFLGYYGVASVSAPYYTTGNPNYSPSLTLCGSSSLPYSSIGNLAVNGEGDASNLWGSEMLAGSVNLGISKFVPQSSTMASSTDTGESSVLSMPYLIKMGLVQPSGGPGDVWLPANAIYDNNYSATLSDEYTDAEALTNAVVIPGNSTTAENSPRAVGFTSRFTSVIFTLFCSNLVDGKAYTVSVDFINLVTGVTTTRQYGIEAAGATATLTDDVPTPPVGQTMTVRSPKIALTPP